MSNLLLDAIDSRHNAPRRSVRRVLCVCYQFPPVGGAGVQRPTKFIKCLRDFGWEASVLTPSNPSVPVFDKSLCAELPEDLVVVKSRTWEPDYRVKQNIASPRATGHDGFLNRVRRACLGPLRTLAGACLQPDPQVLWLPTALGAATQLLRRLRHDAIFATAPPYSDLLLGALLKRRTGLPLILDYRDEWDLSHKYSENSQRSWWSTWVQQRMQRWVLRQADAVITTTESSARRLTAGIAEAGGQARASCIYNGFDAADFSTGEPQRKSSAPRRGRFRLVYTGTLWNLTSIAPLVEALELIHRDTPRLLDELELVVVGRKTPPQRELLQRLSRTGCGVTDEEYCDHSEATRQMQSADALLLLLSDAPGAERVVPGKLFEYLATARPILAIGPDGEAAELLQQFEPGGHFVPSNTPAIAHWLSRTLKSRIVLDNSAKGNPPPQRESIGRFSRHNLTGELVAILNDLATRTGATR